MTDGRTVGATSRLSGTNGENPLDVTGRTQAEAWWRACEAARAVRAARTKRLMGLDSHPHRRPQEGATRRHAGDPVRTPDFEEIRRERSAGRSGCSSFAAGVHPNPRFYKYYWWVFWSESPVDGLEFLSDKYRLSTAAALALSAELKARGEPSWLYNCRLPRRDPANPFDPN